MQTTFSDTLTADDIKRHIPHHFEVPAGATNFHVHLFFEPAVVDGIRNMLTLTVFDPNGFRGAGHRGGNEHIVEIGPDSATPGYRPGPLPAGRWTVQIDTHMILEGEPCSYQISISAEQDPSAVGTINTSLERSTAELLFGAIANPNPGWYRGDLHSHTIHSDASWDVADLVAAAKAKGLDFITLTDHNTVSPLAEMARHSTDGFLTMGGQELTTFWGHAVCLGAHKWLDWRLTQDGDGMAIIANSLYANGQIYIIAHPKDVGDPYCTGCRWIYPHMMPGPARFVEVWNESWIGGREQNRSKNEDGLALWYQWLNLGHRLVATAGSDVHGPKGYANDPGFNTVYADELSEKGILQGISKGHLYLSAGPLLRFTARNGSGTQVIMGEPIATTSTEPMVTFSTEWEDATAGASLRLIVDGKVHDETAAVASGSRAWTLDSRQASWCLVELRNTDGTMLALTNPIFLQAGSTGSEEG